MVKLNKPEMIREVIAFLKTTPAVTLAGQGGAYELLEKWAREVENGA